MIRRKKKEKETETQKLSEQKKNLADFNLFRQIGINELFGVA